MTLSRKLLLALALVPVSVRSARASGAPAVGRLKLQSLLQRFVDQTYKKGFRRLGVEDDFDHGHFLSDAGGKPVAILYHTQELESAPSLDPKARNWLQWLDGRVEDASRLKRALYPRGGQWDLFRETELPELEARHTVLDKMLDPAKVAVDPARTEQWTFTRVDCAAGAGASAGSDSDSDEGLRVKLPGETVCLALSRG